MKRSRNSLLAFVGLTVICLAATLFNGWKPALGLDLQGGASIVLQPNRKVDPATLDQTIGIIRARVDALGVAEPEVQRQDNTIVVSLPGVKDPERAYKIIGQTAELRFRPVLGQLQSEAEERRAKADSEKAKSGLDKSGKGTASTLVKNVTISAPTKSSAVPTTVASTKKKALSLSKGPRFGAGIQQQETTVATTLAGTTTAPPKVDSKSSTTTSASDPKTSDTKALDPKKLGSSTSVTDLAKLTVPSTISAPPTTLANKDGLILTTDVADDLKDRTVVLPEKMHSPEARRYVLGPVMLTGTIVKDAQASVDQNTGGWKVELELTSKGAVAFDKMAAENFQKPVAIVLDGVVLSAPIIQVQNYNGRASIGGSETPKEAKELATALRYGALPVQLVPQTVQTVSATLGSDSLHAGLISGLIGLLAVAAYMLFYYKRFGFIVIAGLMISGSWMWILVSLLSHTQGLALSLSGTVGIIVSVGITVDSYVVFFERIHDEAKSGRSFSASAQSAWDAAWRTIKAADFTSLLGAVVLYQLTVGSVRGFALFLAISTLMDLCVAYFFTRQVIMLMAQKGSPSTGKVGPGQSGSGKPGSGKPGSGKKSAKSGQGGVDQILKPKGNLAAPVAQMGGN